MHSCMHGLFICVRGRGWGGLASLGCFWFKIFWDAFDLKFLILSTNLLTVKTIQQKRLREALLLALNHSARPWQWGANNLYKKSLPQKCVCAGCQLNSDKTLSLLCLFVGIKPENLYFASRPGLEVICLKGHVRARDSTLWWHPWQEVSGFLCTQIRLFQGSSAPQKIAKKKRQCCFWCATNVTLCNRAMHLRPAVCPT